MNFEHLNTGCAVSKLKISAGQGDLAGGGGGPGESTKNGQQQMKSHRNYLELLETHAQNMYSLKILHYFEYVTFDHLCTFCRMIEL